jgi:arylsulfatase A-like enzyme
MTTTVWADYRRQKDFDPSVAHLEYLMEGRKGENSRKLRVYDASERREIDSELANRTIDFMQRSTKAGKPFFAYVPITQVHMATEPGKNFAGSTGHGNFADVLAETDANVGHILDAVSELKISDNTIVIFTSDDGPEDTLPWRGWAGMLQWFLKCATRLASNRWPRAVVRPCRLRMPAMTASG